MDLIMIFLALVVGFMIIGIIAVACQKKDDSLDDDNNDEEYSSRIVISQKVPSVFDTLSGKNRRK